MKEEEEDGQMEPKSWIELTAMTEMERGQHTAQRDWSKSLGPCDPPIPGDFYQPDSPPARWSS